MRTVLSLALLVTVMLTASCSSLIQVEPADTHAISPRPLGGEVSITLYFPTNDGAWLETEERTVMQTGQPLEDIIAQEFLLGPVRTDCTSFFDEDWSLQVDVMEHIAYVSLPRKEMESMGHQHTRIQLQALVNSLTAVEGIHSVQFLINGKQQMSLNVISIGEPWLPAFERVAKEDYRPLRDTDPQKGEYFIEGEILEVIAEENALLIEQHLDSGSREAGPTIVLADDVIIHLQDDEHEVRQELDIGDIAVGDVVGIIMTNDHQARGIIVHRWAH